MHPATEAILKFFAWDHLPPNLQAVSRPIGELAREMAETLPASPEVTTGLRKFLEAKDCLVRAALEGLRDETEEAAAERRYEEAIEAVAASNRAVHRAQQDLVAARRAAESGN